MIDTFIACSAAMYVLGFILTFSFAFREMTIQESIKFFSLFGSFIASLFVALIWPITVGMRVANEISLKRNAK